MFQLNFYKLILFKAEPYTFRPLTMSVALVGLKACRYAAIAPFRPPGSAQLSVDTPSDLLAIPPPIQKVRPRLLPGLTEERPELQERDALPLASREAVSE